MKGLSSKLIADLNKDYDGGVYFEAIIVTRDMSVTPRVKDYFCNYERPIAFEGNIYEVEPMVFDSGFSITSQMELPATKVNLLNIGDVVDTYIHKKGVKIRKNDIVLQILLIDDHGVVSEYDQERLQIQVLSASPQKGTATIFAGLNFRLSDRVPRETLENDEYPGIRQDIIRAGTV